MPKNTFSIFALSTFFFSFKSFAKRKWLTHFSLFILCPPASHRRCRRRRDAFNLLPLLSLTLNCMCIKPRWYKGRGTYWNLIIIRLDCHSSLLHRNNEKLDFMSHRHIRRSKYKIISKFVSLLCQWLALCRCRAE